MRPLCLALALLSAPPAEGPAPMRPDPIRVSVWRSPTPEGGHRGIVASAEVPEALVPLDRVEVRCDDGTTWQVRLFYPVVDDPGLPRSRWRVRYITDPEGGPKLPIGSTVRVRLVGRGAGAMWLDCGITTVEVRP